MNEASYHTIAISEDYAAQIALDLYGIKGDVTQQAGELDINFKIKEGNRSYILKISRAGEDPSFIESQQSLLSFISRDNTINSPQLIPNKQGKKASQILDDSGAKRYVRLLTWIEGSLWSSVNPIKDPLLMSLGNKAGKLSQALGSFNKAPNKKNFDWDIAQVLWTKKYQALFNDDEKELFNYFIHLFESNGEEYASLRKQVVHNDVNDNNIIVSDNKLDPEVIAIIDFGDAIYTQSINDLAICIAYAAMNKPDPLQAAALIVEGYHHSFPLHEVELKFLYHLIGCRLLISLTKSAINKIEEPDNAYLLISEKPAWSLLYAWREIDPQLAYFTFRKACNLNPHPHEAHFKSWADQTKIDIFSLLGDKEKNKIYPLDLSVSSKLIGLENNLSDLDYLRYRFHDIQNKNPEKIIAGGYLEPRIIYSTDAYKKAGNNGPEFRSQHLGIDFWLSPGTPLYSLLDAEVYSIFDNGQNKDYGPTLILKHRFGEFEFYTLYGHLSSSTLDLWKVNQQVKKGELIGYIGDRYENGDWPPHVHFQIMLDMLGNKHDFLGVAFPNEIEVWKSICPDPNLLFKQDELIPTKPLENSKLIDFRKKHLGKSLSLSYNEPLHIVRGSGSFLIDDKGQRYLDTVNNVAHVGHEHPRVVKAGQEQMALLNTNTRYLHPSINEFAENLLKTFPKELSVVHFVNSGSEANELAIRMAKAYTNEKDIIAVEVGYHGNTNSCVDISSYKFDGKGGKGAPEHTHIVPLPDSYRGKYRGEKTGEKYANHIQEKIETITSKGRNIAAFICESIISCGGQIDLPDDYLKIAYQSVRDAGGLCIADEVQVGCGRVGEAFWAFQLHGVIPDIVTIGKPIGNGHPLAAVICTEKVANAFANGMEYFNTFGGNPVSAIIGNEVLAVLRDENLQEHAHIIGHYLKSELAKLQTRYPILGDIRGKGLFLGIELVAKDKSPLPDHASYLVNRMKELKILMSTDGKDNNVLKIKPPMVFSRGDCDQLLSGLDKILGEDYMQL